MHGLAKRFIKQWLLRQLALLDEPPEAKEQVWWLVQKHGTHNVIHSTPPTNQKGLEADGWKITQLVRKK